MTLIDRAREIASGRPARPDVPVEIQPEELTPADPPEIRGFRYFVHKKWGVLRARAELEPDTTDWPELPYVEERRDDDGIRWARLYEIVDAATWERLTMPRPVRASDPAPTVPVDALRRLPTYARDPEVLIPGSPRGVDILSVQSVEYAATHPTPRESRLIRGRDRATTPAEMVERFTRKGITLSVAPDGRLVAGSSDGRISEFEREALRRSARFLAGYLSGKPLSCAWCQSAAATVLEPELVPACTEHAS